MLCTINQRGQEEVSSRSLFKFKCPTSQWPRRTEENSEASQSEWPLRSKFDPEYGSVITTTP
jgi:hypothetical protein